jgi:hypothetical protein
MLWLPIFPQTRVFEMVTSFFILVIYQVSHVAWLMFFVAMNEINSSQRMREAAYQKAEGDKVVKVKRAEAAAESMYLSGVGVSKERKAIMDGLK